MVRSDPPPTFVLLGTIQSSSPPVLRRSFSSFGFPFPPCFLMNCANPFRARSAFFLLNFFSLFPASIVVFYSVRPFLVRQLLGLVLVLCGNFLLFFFFFVFGFMLPGRLVSCFSLPFPLFYSLLVIPYDPHLYSFCFFFFRIPHWWWSAILLGLFLPENRLCFLVFREHFRVCKNFRFFAIAFVAVFLTFLVPLLVFFLFHY